MIHDNPNGLRSTGHARHDPITQMNLSFDPSLATGLASPPQRAKRMEAITINGPQPPSRSPRHRNHQNG
jgi:hypothetical protein